MSTVCCSTFSYQLSTINNSLCLPGFLNKNTKRYFKVFHRNFFITPQGDHKDEDQKAHHDNQFYSDDMLYKPSHFIGSVRNVLEKIPSDLQVTHVSCCYYSDEILIFVTK